MSVIGNQVKVAGLYISAYSSDCDQMENWLVDHRKSMFCDKLQQRMERGAFSFSVVKDVWEEYRQLHATVSPEQRERLKPLAPRILSLLDIWESSASVVRQVWEEWKAEYESYPYSADIAESFLVCFEDLEDIRAEYRMSKSGLTNAQLQAALDKDVFTAPPPGYYADPEEDAFAAECRNRDKE